MFKLSTSRQRLRSLVKPPTLIQDAAKTAPPACGGMLHLGHGSHPYPRLPHPDCLPTQSELHVRGPGGGCEALPGAPCGTQAYWPGEEGGCASRAGVQAERARAAARRGASRGVATGSDGGLNLAGPLRALPRRTRVQRACLDGARGWAGCAAACEKWTGSEGMGGFARARKHSPDAAAVESSAERGASGSPRTAGSEWAECAKGNLSAADRRAARRLVAAAVHVIACQVVIRVQHAWHLGKLLPFRLGLQRVWRGGGGGG